MRSGLASSFLRPCIDMTAIQEKLFALQDLGYGDFHSKLMPTVDGELVIGVRTPELRQFAKEFSKTDMAEDFLSTLPHKYYEENNLHAFMISLMKDYDAVIEKLNNIN